MNKKIILFLLLIVAITASCGKKNIRSASAQELYADATNELYNKKTGFPWIFTGPNYDLILETLKEIRLRYTFSPFATLAEIRTADTYFEQGEYQQAIVEYEQFLKDHPGHNEYPYAIYKLAMSNYELRTSKDKEPSFTRNAVTKFGEFIQRYPESELVPEAEEKIAECEKILAARELHIGKFYLKKKNYKAAFERFNLVVEQYPDTKHYNEAVKLIAKIPKDTSLE